MLSPSCVCAHRFNLSDSLGRPLFANIQISLVCGRYCLFKPALFASLLTIAAPARSGVPQDRRARKVSVPSNPRCCPPFPQPQPLSFCRCTHKLAEVWNHEALGKASTSFTHPFALPPRRCRAGCRPTRWYALFSRATCTQFFLSTPPRVLFTGNRQGHPRRCAYVFPCWSPDAEHVCAQN